MFPPICFVDVTKGAVAYAETEEEMKEVLDEEEYNMVNNRANEKAKKNTGSIFKFQKDNKSLTNKTTNNSNNNIVKKGNTNTGKQEAKTTEKPAIVDNTEDNNIVIKFKLGELMKNFFDNL